MPYFRALFAALAFLGLCASAEAASIPLTTGPQDPSQLQATTNALINSINSNLPSFGSTFVGKNYLDNAAFAINQRGTATAVTGGTTSGPAATAYGSDRWAVETNVTSGAGKGQVVTSVSGVTLAPTQQNAFSLFRNSGALTQPISLEQFIETQRFRQLQGKSVIMSCFLAANAGAPTGVTATFHLFTGTGTNEGLGSSTVYGSAVGMTASPALTPVLTGLATAGTFTTPALTSTSTRYSSGPIAVPLTATEGVFELDWTPGAETFGSTDGIVVQGCQLEQADINQTTASAFEFLPPQIDLARSQRFYYELDESAVIFVAGACKAESVTVATCYVQFPIPMAAAAQMSYANGFATETTAAGGTLGPCTGLATATTVTSTAPNNQGILVGCTAATVPAAGSAGMLYSNNGTGKIKASADF